MTAVGEGIFEPRGNFPRAVALIVPAGPICAGIDGTAIAQKRQRGVAFHASTQSR